MSKIENNICEAIELIVNKSISEAGYDRTVQAIVKSCEDASIGKYKVSYQGSSFYAYSTSTDVKYSNNAAVYVLIPANDMSKDKTILGAVDKLGVDYVTQAEGDEAYDIIGTNCVSSSDIYQLSSYRKHNSPAANPTSYVQVIYAADSKNNSLVIDEVAANEYIKQSSSLICGAVFKTNLLKEQQYQGNYGIIFGLDFLDNAGGSTVTRYYTVDVDNMIGNPYQLTLGRRQYGIFTIDGANFVRIASISLFTSDFSHHKSDDEITKEKLFDITVSQVELCAAQRMSESELNGCGISFITPEGTFFSTTASAQAKLPITAQVKVKGKVVDAKTQNIPFYWYMEDVSITAKNEKYNKYGGRGWRCLNDYNIIEEETDENTRQVEWVPYNETYELKINEANARENKIKCVILYDGITYSKEIIIKNLKAPTLTIESNMGTQFSYDNGRPILTCYVDNKIEPNYIYYWAVEDAYGNLTTLPKDENENNISYNDYIKAKEELEALQSSIASGKDMPNASRERLAYLQSIINEFEHLQMVHSYQLLNVAINEITNFAVYKCSVFDKNRKYYGTASIRLTNSLETKDGYTLIINNGTQTYQYNEYGVSPASPAADNPISIPALTFTVYDNMGRPLDEEIIRKCKISWKIPATNTMIIVNETDGRAEGMDAANEYQYYSQATIVAYGIQNKYYYNYKNNDIELFVTYKDLTLTEKTNLTFVKTGEDGTNGTEYTAKIVPNSKSTNLPKYPTFIILDDMPYGYFNFDNFYVGSSYSSVAPFCVKLYKAGEEIFSGSSDGSAIDEEGTKVTLKWEMLANKYDSMHYDTSDLTIAEKNGTIKYVGGPIYSGIPGANIIKCTINYGNYNIYATLPIIIAKSNSDYRINLKENTGFRYVEYASDGTNPKYDTTKPFEIEVTKRIGDFDEVVSMINGKEAITDFRWEVKNRIYNHTTGYYTTAVDGLVEQKVNGLAANQHSYKPTTNYNGLCVNNTIICKCSAGTIYIPVHFFRNRYGLAELNGWDGNSIQINDDGGYILAPEMGAGRKETDNSFTGVLMGEVQEPNRKTSDIGLLGYNHGERSFFVSAEDGHAQFGGGAGSITVDPSNKQALLYSNNFWERYNDNGLPDSYAKTNYNNEGMLIDLSTPEIRFGSGAFYVTKEGYAHIGGGADIAGWSVEEHQLSSNSGNTGMNSSTGTGGKIVSAPLPSNNTNKYVAFWAGSTATPNFYVTHDGYLRANDATIGSGTNKIYIGKSSEDKSSNSALYTSNKPSKNKGTSGFYLGVDGFALGSTHDIDYDNDGTAELTVSNFQIDNNGVFYAKNGFIGSETNGWKITNSALTNKKTNYNETENNGVYLGTNGIGLGKGKFYVNNQGALYSVSGTIGGWTINDHKIRGGDETTGVAVMQIPQSASSWVFAAGGTTHSSYNDCPFRVRKDGYLVASNAAITGNIIANGGKIGDFTITKQNGYSAIYSSDKSTFDSTKPGVYLGTDGISLGKKGVFSVNDQGELIATNATITGNITAKAGKIGNFNISDAIYSGTKSTLNADTVAGVYLGTDGIALGKGAFKVTNAGTLTSTSGTIGGWTINKTSISQTKKSDDGTEYNVIVANYDNNNAGSRVFHCQVNGNDTFYVHRNGKLFAKNADIEGKITATSGSFTGTINASSGNIGGWTIGGNSLSSGNMFINSGGSLSGSNWSIDTNGKAIFSNMNITGGSINPSETKLDGEEFDKYIKDLIVDNLTIDKQFIFKNESIGWTQVISNIQISSLDISGTSAGSCTFIFKYVDALTNKSSESEGNSYTTYFSLNK